MWFKVHFFHYLLPLKWEHSIQLYQIRNGFENRLYMTLHFNLKALCNIKHKMIKVQTRIVKSMYKARRIGCSPQQLTWLFDWKLSLYKSLMIFQLEKWGVICLMSFRVPVFSWSRWAGTRRRDNNKMFSLYSPEGLLVQL